MTAAPHKIFCLVLAIVGGGLLWLAGWRVWHGSPDSARHAATSESARIGPQAAIPLEMPADGRLSLDRESLPSDGSLQLVLDLPDRARGAGDRSARIVSTSGRRIDTTARAMPGSGSGVSIEIEAAALSPGRYLIEVDTLDEHPLKLRRFVLEVR